MYKSDEVYLTCYLLCCTCYVGYLFLEPSSKACSQARYLVPNVCRIYNMKAIKDMTSSQKVEAELPHQGGAVLNYIIITGECIFKWKIHNKNTTHVFIDVYIPL